MTERLTSLSHAVENALVLARGNGYSFAIVPAGSPTITVQRRLSMYSECYDHGKRMAGLLHALTAFGLAGDNWVLPSPPGNGHWAAAVLRVH
jgi:hypothetical protein